MLLKLIKKASKRLPLTVLALSVTLCLASALFIMLNERELRSNIKDNAKEKSYFLILSNGRSGSSWLQCLLADVLGIEPTLEFKWIQSKDYPIQPVHVKIGSGDVDIKYKIDRLRKDLKYSISSDKLVFDPYNFLSESAFDELFNYFKKNRDIKLIFLKRNYYELFLSWNCRGVCHKSRQTGKILGGSGEVRRVFVFGIPNFSDNQTVKRYELCQDKKVGMHFLEAKRKLFVFFYNDVMIAEMLRKLDSNMVIDYENIPTDFESILNFLEINVSNAKRKYTLRNSRTMKLPSLEGLVYPEEVLVNLSNLLKGKLRSILNKEKKASDLFSWDEKKEKILIHDPELLKEFGTELR